MVSLGMGYRVSGQGLCGFWSGVMGSLGRAYGVSGQGLWGLWAGLMQSLGGVPQNNQNLANSHPPSPHPTRLLGTHFHT